MTEKRLLGEGPDAGLAPDQRAVFDAYYDEDGVICTPAGSGTGKTTTAIEVVAEAVVRQLEADPGRNPFESILVTTFTKDAARQLKTELKRRLDEHRRVAPDHDPVVAHWEKLLRWLETASHVRTIDSFTQDLLREIALEAGIAPSFGVADGIRRSDLLEDVFGHLREDPDLADPIDRLETAFPTDGDGEDWESIVVELHRRCREFCMPIEEARRELLRSVTAIHDGREPETFADLVAIADALVDFDAVHVREGLDDHEAWVEHARETYRASRRLAGDLGVVLSAFDRRYDDWSRSRGTLTHTDITYVVREYLEPGGADGDRGAGGGDPDSRRERVRRSLVDRFDHVVVDEFQDTNYAQCRILSHLLPGANALLIGDLKQSIYEWRSAEPRLFADLIADAQGTGEGNVLDADRVVPVPLAENFRSHPHLVAAANHVFPRIFSDPGRGGIGTFDVEYDRLSAMRAETEPGDPHVHVLRLDDPDRDEGQSRREALVEAEAERVAGTLRTVLDEATLSVDRRLDTVVGDRAEASDRTAGDGTDGDEDGDPADALDPVRPGDVAILFRTRTYMRHYSRVLDRYGIDNAVLGTHSLYDEPEIAALVDALAWVGDPGPGRLERVVETVVAAVGPAARKRLAETGHDLDAAVAATDGDSTAGADLRALAGLRDELRYERAGRKGRIVSALLAHSAFDVVALADRDGLQRYANVRRFVEVIDDWEDDDPLAYGEFVRRLRRLRDGRIEDDQSIAAVADMDSADTVKLLTAHSAKGLEFPVVVLADTARNEAYQKACDEPFVADRRHGIAVRPTTGGSEQPDAGSIPTFSGGWFHEDDSEYDFDRGLLWVSECRGTDGRIRHEHPLTDYVRDARAEFWRLLYVAVTRAGDHLIVPVGETRGTTARYNTWAAALAESLAPGDDGVLDTDDGPVPVGVDDLPVADPPSETSPAFADLLSTVGGPRNRDRSRTFAPRTLAATGVADLLADPAAYQRTALWGLDAGSGVEAHEPTDGTGTGAVGRALDVDAIAADPAGRPPGNLSPTEWGDAVHAALEALNRTGDPAALDGDRLRELLGRAVDRSVGPHPAADDVADRLATSVIPAYRRTGTWEAATGGADRFPEFRILAPLSGAGRGGDRPTYVRGRIDLLYRTDGWRIADYKTGPVPDGDRLGASRTQLSAYAWLLWAVYGVEVAGADLVYLDPGPEEIPVDVDPAAFGDRLADAVAGLTVDGDGVLRRRD